ncbi:import receptor [Fimicolochytrium jonesii]|uniref:import receptor n=1 Tax=Fimicolochytrium jonesii TaxID=1396493 RepID=UPI0022FDC813|nr:import receptor [Fimicolochytrium jonesii]KAI8819490.1 import receptor [Fimicolochytrium jonesii]
MASTAPAASAASRFSKDATWKTVLAVTVAGVVVGAGAWYLLSQRPSENSKKAQPTPKKPSSSTGASNLKRKTKSKTTLVEKKNVTVAEAAAPSLDDLTPAEAATVAPAETVEGVQAYPQNLFPANPDALSEKERADLAKSAKTLGNKYYGEKKYQEAIDLYSQAIVLQPDAVFYSNRAACYANLNDYDNVINDCTEALKLDNQYLKALNRRAQAYESQEKWSESLNDYTVMCVLEEFKNESVLGSCDRILKNFAQSKAQEQIKNKVPRLPSDTFITAFMDSFRLTSKGAKTIVQHKAEKPGDKLVKKAFQGIIDHKWDEAQTATVEAVESGELSAFWEPLAYNLRATFGFLRGDVDLAMTDLEKSLEADPKNVNTIIKRASIYMERAEVEKAIEEYNRAIELDPRDPDVYYHRGQIRVLTNDNQGAIDDYKKSISLDSDFVYAHIQLGVAQYKLGDVGGAQTTFEKARRKFKNSPEVYNYNGEILLDTQQYEEALKNFDKALGIAPNSPLPYINKAILYLQWKQDATTAEIECRKAIAVDPYCDIAYAQLAQLLLHQGKFSDSLDAYDKAAALARTEPELANALALREAAAAQLHVATYYPEVIARLRGGAGFGVE